MLLELRVDRRPHPLRIRVEAARGATFAHLREALALPAGIRVGGSSLPDSTPLGRPPLLDHAVLTDPASAPRTRGVDHGPTPALALLRLYVLAGPDNGRVFPLPPGQHTIGRSSSATLTLTDPTLSRVHARLAVTGDGASISDCGSTNPGSLRGQTIGLKPVALQPNQPAQLGQTRFEIRTPTELPATVRPDDEGHLIVHRPPRMPATSPAVAIEFPTPPTELSPTRLPLVALALPLVLAGLMAALLRSPTMLLFGLMSPALVLGTWWQDRRSGRRTTRAARTAYRIALQEAENALSDALAAEQVCRRQADPHPAALLDTARSRLTTLWDREASQGLTVRIGTGRTRATTTAAGVERDGRVDEVPIVVHLSPGNGLGIVGPREAALRVARAALGAAVVRHGPSGLRVQVDGDAETWEWTARLPHTASRALTVGTRPTGRATLLVVDCVEPASRVTPQPVPPDAIVIALAPTRSALPATATTVIEVGEGGVSRPDMPRVSGHADVTDLVCDEVSQLWAEELADALAPLREAATSGQAHLPDRVRLWDLVAPASGVDSPDPRPLIGATLTDLWSRRPAEARLPLGVGSAGPVVVDLDHDGPHFLVGGTTGSGKSELLVSLVAAAAALNRPDELCFVLVDYKGGAAFGACRDLPHVVGMVTDLDQHLAERALASLTAELRRRERLLAERGCPDLATYRRLRTEGEPRLARLVIVIDEFRSLADELPDLIQGLVRIAALGRSLGVHLVIATQRPGGAITADMRANLSGRIALRVRDAVDSIDVIGAPTAADLPHHAPGRALLHSAATAVTEFQTARVTAPLPDAAAAPVRVVSIDGIPLPAPPESEQNPTDLDVLVTAAQEATAALDARPPASPWLPPLPTVLRVEELASADSALAVGLLDDPTHLQQRPWTWDPVQDGPLAVVGSARSGRTSTLRALAHLVTSQQGTPRQVYAVHAGALADLAALPLCGASVAATDVARVDRLLDVLRTASSGPLRRLLLVDDWERVIDQISQSGQAGHPASPGARVADRLQATVRDAADHQLDVAVAGGRALLTGAMSARFGTRLLLLPADPIDLTCAGLRPSQAPQQAPPGRAIDPSTGLLLQLAHVPLQRAGAEGRPELDPPSRLVPTEWAPVGVPELPTRVSLADLAPVAGELILGTDGTRPVGLRLADGSRRLVIVGQQGSGRSTALRTLAAALAAAGMPVAHLSAAGSGAVSPTRAEPISWLSHDQVDDLIALRREHPNLAVLVDDAHRCDSGPLDEVVREIAKLVDEDQGFIALATTSQHSADAVTSLAGTLTRSGEALLLGALPAGFERYCALTAPLVSQATPGRGYLVRHGIPTAVQVAVPDQVSSP